MYTFFKNKLKSYNEKNMKLKVHIRHRENTCI